MAIAGRYRDYDSLPEAIRCAVTRDEWAWMPDAQKHQILTSATEHEEPIEDPPA